MEGARVGERLVGRKLLRHEGGRVVVGCVGTYSAELDQFVATFDDGMNMILGWDELEEYVPLLPLVREARPKMRAEAVAKTKSEAKSPKPRKEATKAGIKEAGTKEASQEAADEGLRQTNLLAARTLRNLLVALVEADRSAHPDDKRSILRSLKDHSQSDVAALNRFAASGGISLVLDALAAITAAAEGNMAGADVGVGVLLSVAAAAASSESSSRKETNKLCALWRWRTGVGSHDELDDVAGWGLRAWSRFGSDDQTKTEKKEKKEEKEEKEKTEKTEGFKATKAEWVKKEKANAAPVKATQKEKKRPRTVERAPVPTAGRSSPPTAASPPCVARVPTAEMPKKKPRPLLRTARIDRESDAVETRGEDGAPSARTRRVRFREMPRALDFCSDDVASTVSGRSAA